MAQSFESLRQLYILVSSANFKIQFPSQHTRTAPVWDLSGLTGWAGRGILQRERHGTRQSIPASLQRCAVVSGFRIRPTDILSLLHAHAVMPLLRKQ